MKAFGGYFELEIGSARGAYHKGVDGLCSGRACLGRILDAIRPTKVHAPFYLCDSALLPMRARGIEVQFYALNDALEPAESIAPADGDTLMVVNYFGLLGGLAGSTAAALGRQAIVDDTQAFFQRGYGDAWSFNSARKFFGVPDGGYAYGPGLHAADGARFERPRHDHLIARLAGDVEGGYRAYLEAEAAVPAEPLKMSVLSERLLAAIDYTSAGEIRCRNFRRMHERLGGRNRLTAGVLQQPPQAPPFCYPFLPSQPVPLREELWKARVFVPTLWPDVIERRVSGYERERRFAADLWPLPIDQRYGDRDVDEICDRINEVCGW
jgi:hypothetical protein